MYKPKKRSISDINYRGGNGFCGEENRRKHELFLQAFEKPTQIYRFLKSRHLISSVFLNRNLSYMRHRMSRNNKGRKSFDIDSILQRKEEKTKDAGSLSSRGYGNLSIVFTGILDKRNGFGNPTVTVATDIIMTCHKKRKDSSTPNNLIRIAKCPVAVNPNDEEKAMKSAITITKDNFTPSNGHLVKSCSLQFTATYSNTSSINNNYLSDGISSDDSERPYKKRRVQNKCECRGELVIFDKHQKCLLSPGEYQIVIHETLNGTNQHILAPHRTNKILTWEQVSINSKVNSAFEKGPVLIFHVRWNDSLFDGVPNTTKPIFINSSIQEGVNNENNSSLLNHDHSISQAPMDSFKSVQMSKSECLTNLKCPKDSARITYQFSYNSNTLQETKAHLDFKCPWCTLNCMQLYSLLKHLKLCHNRLCFTYQPEEKGPKIEVTMNDNYDGSYSGNPHDLSHATTIGVAFSRNGPVQRTPVTHILVWRSKKLQQKERHQSLSEFMDVDDSDGKDVRGIVSGHGHRLYYHTNTCIPITPQEMDEDSEMENDPEWERIKTQLMIDDFSDVNEGEKEVMKLWNILVMNHGFVGDCQIPLACDVFVNTHWKVIQERNLYKNFVLHMINLHDFGLLNASHLKSTVRKLLLNIHLKIESCSKSIDNEIPCKDVKLECVKFD